MTITADHTKALREVKRITGRSVAVPMMASVTDVDFKADSITVTLDMYEVTEKATEYCVTRSGIRLYKFTKSLDGRWSPARVLTLWNDEAEFEPFIIGKTYKRVTPESFREAVEYARQCYRPGTSTNPLDSYSRVLEGHTTARMERHF